MKGVTPENAKQKYSQAKDEFLQITKGKGTINFVGEDNTDWRKKYNELQTPDMLEYSDCLNEIVNYLIISRFNHNVKRNKIVKDYFEGSSLNEFKLTLCFTPIFFAVSTYFASGSVIAPTEKSNLHDMKLMPMNAELKKSRKQLVILNIKQVC